MTVSTNKSFLPDRSGKDIRYLNRDFSQFKDQLIQFAKSYFPNTYQDFSDSSPGTMFIEMASYVGDVLSFYTDHALNESLFENAIERKNIIAQARARGYKIKPSKASTGILDVYQLCPSTVGPSGEYLPDPNYMLTLKENVQLKNGSGIFYRTIEPVNFSVDTKLSPRTTTVYSRNQFGIPDFFLLKKSVKISSGQLVKKQFQVGTPTQFLKLYFDENNVLEVIDVRDSDNNRWYEVDYLAQELVSIDIPNDSEHEGALSEVNGEVPYILKYLRTSRRFVSNVDENNLTYLEFGPGSEGFSDELVNISSQTVGVGLRNLSNLNVSLDPSNFLKNESYGLSPANTTLTVTYSIGGGILSNCGTNDINSIVFVEFGNSSDGLTPEETTLLNTVKASVRVTNPSPITGGKDSESNEEIKQNASAFYASQNRVVTREDYLVRIYSMPPKYGTIAKAQVISNSNLNVNVKRILDGNVDTSNNSTTNDSGIENFFRKISYDVSNPFSVNVYLLSYDSNKKLTVANSALISNLSKYLKQYRILTDGINIIDGYIINIAIDFVISVYKGYNKKEVLKEAIGVVKNFFDIDKWNFSQPINLNHIELEIAKVEGVQSVVSVKISNKTILDGAEYSPIEYDIDSATKNKIVYPSLDPSVFEVKFPDKDIRGSVI